MAHSIHVGAPADGSLKDTSFNRLACLFRHWTWADEAMARFERELANGWEYRRRSARRSPFGAYYHWCALFCGFAEAALEQGLLSGSRLDALRPDLEASLPACERAGSCSSGSPRRSRSSRASSTCSATMRRSIVFVVSIARLVKRSARSSCLANSTCCPTSGGSQMNKNDQPKTAPASGCRARDCSRTSAPTPDLSDAASDGLFRGAESVGRRLSAVPAASRVHGAGDDQRRLCLLAGAARFRDRALPRPEPGVHRRHRGGGRCSGDGRLCGWLREGPQHLADSVTRCIATGVAGLSIEDATGVPSSPLYDLPLAVERVRAGRQAIDQSRADVLLTARAECYLVGHADPLRESIRRLQAYAEAGADVLFAPGAHAPAEIAALVEAVRPKPIDLLVVRDSGLSVSDIAALGVRRISVGGALALAAWTGFTRAAQMLRSEGSFAGLSHLVPYTDINELFTTDYRTRQADGPRE